jgi:hypothetical protein
LGSANAVFNIDNLEDYYMSDETTEQTFQVPAGAPARLEVSNISGSVEVLPGEAGVITITVVKHPHTGDLGRTDVKVSQAEDGSVKAEVKYRDILQFLSLSKPCQVSFTARVPAQCSVQASVVSSSAKIHNLEGSINITSVSGEITLAELTGPVQLNTVSGDVDGEALQGELKFQSVSGNVRLKNSKLPTVTGNTVSGDVALQTALTEGPYAVHTVSGDVRLTVPVDTHCTAEVRGISGQVHTAFPQTTYHHKNGSHIAEVQGGGVLVKLSGVSGDLWIGTAEGEKPEPAPQTAPQPTQPVQPVQPAGPSRKEILDRIERGEITVEEGLKLLG